MDATLTIWVDADACPQALKEVLVRVSQRRGVAMVFVANQALSLPASLLIRIQQVPKGPDVADAAIVEQCQAVDIVVTQDIPLAALVIAKGAVAINLQGDLLQASNIGQRLALRDLMTDLRDGGLITGGPKPFSTKQKETFTNALDRVLTQQQKHWQKNLSS